MVDVFLIGHPRLDKGVGELLRPVETTLPISPNGTICTSPAEVAQAHRTQGHALDDPGMAAEIHDIADGDRILDEDEHPL